MPVAFACGIAAWLTLAGWTGWLSAAALALVVTAIGVWFQRRSAPYTGQALAAAGAMFLAGMLVVSAKSGLVGAAPISAPIVTTFDGKIIAREEMRAEGRTRLTVETTLPQQSRAVRVRVNLPTTMDGPSLHSGTWIRLRARLLPPAPPILPGAYDFSRAAWFSGLSATGTALGAPQVIAAGKHGSTLETVQTGLSEHIRSRLSGSEGGIAAAFASGDRGGIDPADEEAMRDAGLTHLLSISGLHVSAVVGASYILTLRLLALWPWLALRVRLPLVAAAAGAGAGVGYTLLTGAEVPTIRSCIGALLVLMAIALGREPLSLRMLAVAAFVVLLFWPEAVVTPGFQMSFGSVVAIIALNDSAPMRRFAERREGQRLHDRLLRELAVILLTGLVIELALMPIALFYFHRAGLYGAVANVIAIPLTTFVIMPLEAVSLLADLAGLGGPLWWLCGKSLPLLLGLARWTAGQPGAVTQLPAMSGWTFGLFLAGALWLALWRGRVRLWGLAPMIVAGLALLTLKTPDVLVSGDGRYVGITGQGPDLLVIRGREGSFGGDSLLEIAGMEGRLRNLADWPGARCSLDFCSMVLEREAQSTTLLIARSRMQVDELQLAAACELADVVIADRRLPFSCRPRWLKLDRRFLAANGGVTLDLADRSYRTVAQERGHHGWERAAGR